MPSRTELMAALYAIAPLTMLARAELLASIPKYPKFISTPELYKERHGKSWSQLTKRSIERILDEWALYYGCVTYCRKENNKTKLWTRHVVLR